VLLQGFPVGLPHVDIEPDLFQVAVEEGLDLAFVAGDARNPNNVLKKLDRLFTIRVDRLDDFFADVGHLVSFHLAG